MPELPPVRPQPEATNADVEIGQRSVTVAHLGNIARWVGGKLEWDPAEERFTNCDRANRTWNGSSGRGTSCRRRERQDVSAMRSLSGMCARLP